MANYSEHERALAAHIEMVPGINRLRELLDVDASPETSAAILDAAARFAERVLDPVNKTGDRNGSKLVNGRVQAADGYVEAQEAFLAEGWPTLDALEKWGGQGLPLVFHSAAQEMFDRGCVAFGMLLAPQRAGAKLLDAHAEDALKAEWLPKLATGEWSTTICISEPDAGSDVGRLRTFGTKNADGSWAITGEKCWISFGDHNLNKRIAHCLIARTEVGSKGTHGLSLFLVPDRFFENDGTTTRNSIFVRRLEEKLGLHGSPTCALGFEGARGFLIGKEGKGLQALFTMISTMRLSVAVQGVGIASAAVATAFSYAEERRQGGPANAPPVTIRNHADIQRMLMRMAARVEMLRGLVMTLAVNVELSEIETDATARDNNGALATMLLPIAKTLAAEAAFDCSSDAIQILGGAGYTQEWGVEQNLRDARIFAIYEGTSGIQALDILHRRLWRDKARGFDLFIAQARADVATSAHKTEGQTLAQVLDILESTMAKLNAWATSPFEAEAGANAFLQLAGVAATSWIALRLVNSTHESAAAPRLAALGRFALSDAVLRAQALAGEIALGAKRLKDFDAVAASFQ